MSEIFLIVSDPLQPASVTQTALDPLTRSDDLRQFVRKACKALDFKESKKEKVTLSHLLYDDTHRVIYCYIPKVWIERGHARFFAF